MTTNHFNIKGLTDNEVLEARQKLKLLAQFFEFEQLTHTQLGIGVGIGFLSVIWFELIKLYKRRLFLDPLSIFNKKKKKYGTSTRASKIHLSDAPANHTRCARQMSVMRYEFRTDENRCRRRTW